MFRDLKTMLFSSVFFEFLEMTFEHILLNFQECWWDHWIVDVLICNNIGLFAGLYVLRLFQGKEHNFIGNFEESATREKSVAKNFLSSVFPESMRNYRWRLLESPRRWFGFWFLIFMVIFAFSSFFSLVSAVFRRSMPSFSSGFFGILLRLRIQLSLFVLFFGGDGVSPLSTSYMNILTIRTPPTLLLLLPFLPDSLTSHCKESKTHRSIFVADSCHFRGRIASHF